MINKMIAIAATAGLLAACSSEPTIQTGEGAEVIGDNLHRIDNSRARAAWIDPDADFPRYTKVLVRPLGVEKIEVIQPDRNNSSIRRGDWELTDSDKVMLQEMFHKAMVKQLQEKGEFPLVTEPGDDVIEIAAMITSIAPTAGKDDVAGRSRVYTEGAGSIAVAVAYGDSETGEILALVKDARSSSTHWGQNNSVSNRSDVQRMFNAWAIQVNNSLVKVTGRRE